MTSLLRTRLLGGLVAIAASSPFTLPGAPVAPPRTRQQGWYAGPAGGSSGAGTRASPWDLQTALSGAGGTVQPGDTVWIRGGRYEGINFTTALVGTAAARITFRAYPGERATIDGRLLARGAYLDFWGLEIMQSAPLTHPDVQLLDIRTDHGRFINLVLHDANTHGANLWTPGVDAELYGSIIYNNGTHENLDHGVYVHNDTGTKRVTDNVFFNNYARGIQVYASHNNDVLRNVVAEGNIAFNNGTISARSSRVNLLFNAQTPVEGMAAVDNLLFFSSGTDGVNLSAGKFPQRYRDLVVRGNVLAGGEAGLELGQAWSSVMVERNVVVVEDGAIAARITGGDLARAYRWRDNSYHARAEAKAWAFDGTRYPLAQWRAHTGLAAADRVLPRPTSPLVVVRPNRFEAGRAHVAVVNYTGLPSVDVSVRGILREGDRYVVQNVQDLWGAPAASGIYRGGDRISLPMRGVTPPRPLGRRTPREPVRTGPRFDVFLLSRVAR